uniref:Uncharacterized protein n=1 Tax=Anabas testudineus TaxID=64144 RepID=A0A3Q1H069_ANATE
YKRSQQKTGKECLMNLFLLALIISLPVSQVAGVYCDGGFNLQLGHLHTVVEDPEKLF